MGLKDRIQGIRQYVSTPVSVWMADTGSDAIAHPGKTARVVVKVDGENDGSIEGIDLTLRYSGEVPGEYTWIQLASVPIEAGVHELIVDIPAGLAPSVARVNEYAFFAKTRRTKGLESDAQSAVDIIGRPEDLYWPDGPRSGQDGAVDDVRIEVELDTELVEVGGSLSGRVTVLALRDVGKDDVELVLGAEVAAIYGGPPPKTVVKFRERAKAELQSGTRLVAGERLELPFKVEVPADVPPTVYGHAGNSVIWRVEARFAKARAWRFVGVLDPEGHAGNRNHKQHSSLLLFWD